MTDAVVVHTRLPDSTSAGADLGDRIVSAFDAQPPDAVIVFASSSYRAHDVLKALMSACRPAVLVGCTSAGEFTSDAQHEGSACALALRSGSMQFTATLGRGLRADRQRAAAELVAGFRGLKQHDYRYRSALILTDALAGHADDLVQMVTRLTAGTYQFFGGGAGDDARFQQTHVFCGTEAVSDAVVALEILSNAPIGIGAGHGWEPASAPLRVTEAEGVCVRSLNAAPSAEAFEDHAEATRQTFDPADPLPYFLHNVLGIETDQGHKLRVPLNVNEDGSVVCAADIPPDTIVRIMGTTDASAAEAAARATRAARAQLGSHRPKAALVFDCVATRLRLGKAFGSELAAVAQELSEVTYAGCNTYGQIVRVDGQFSGFHNCTAVVCLIPE